jgi:hypothetical protein
MTGLALTMLLGIGLAGAPASDIICQTREVPELISGSRSRHVYVLHHQTHCYPAPSAGEEQLEKLKQACDLLVTAYGEEEGRLRCQGLLKGVELDP